MVDNFIEFPMTYKPKGALDVLPQIFPSDSIIVGKSIHGTDTELFHLFININYKLSLNNKKVGSANNIS